MDNTNNKQFFWHVKDFLGKKHQPNPNPKPSSLVSAVKQVVNFKQNNVGPNIYEARDGIVNSSRQTKAAVSNVLNTFDSAMQKQKSSCKAYSNNITGNLFNLFKK
jgi:hypothetical protein